MASLFSQICDLNKTVVCGHCAKYTEYIHSTFKHGVVLLVTFLVLFLVVLQVPQGFKFIMKFYFNFRQPLLTVSMFFL